MVCPPILPAKRSGASGILGTRVWGDCCHHVCSLMVARRRQRSAVIRYSSFAVANGLRFFVMTIVFGVWAGCDLPERPPLGPIDLADEIEPNGAVSNGAGSNGNGLATGGSVSSFGNSYRPGNALAGRSGGVMPESEPPPRLMFSGDWETWDVYMIGDRPVGYNHVRAESIRQSVDSGEVQYTLDDVLFINQGKSRTLQRLVQTSRETRTGQLVAFNSMLHVGPVVTRFDGLVDGDRLKIESLRGSTRTVKTIPWNDRNSGLVAIEQTLRAKPLTDKGQMRMLDLLLPGRYVSARARLRCNGTASVPMMDKSLAELIEIDYELEIDGEAAARSTIWTDDSGAIVRTFSPGMKLLSYRTDRATAIAAASDLDEAVAVNITGKFDRPAIAKRLAISISPNKAAQRSEKPLMIVPMPGQLVRTMDDGAFQVLVSRMNESTNTSGFAKSDLQPTDADTAPTPLVNYRSTLIRRYADAAVAKKGLTTREIAIEMMQTSGSLIDLSDEPEGLVSADRVAQNSRGDITGRAIFLCALLRARNVPARLAIGLRYNPDPSPRMVYHVWTIAFVDGEWLHLDAGRVTEAPADRLMLATTTLAGKNEYDDFVPFLNAASRMDLTILRAQY